MVQRQWGIVIASVPLAQVGAMGPKLDWQSEKQSEEIQNLIEWYFTLFAFAMFSRLVLCKNQHIK